MNRKMLMTVVAASVALAAGAAQAQNEANWSGPYVGLNGGWNWSQDHTHGSQTTVNQLSGVDAGAGAVTVPPTSSPTGRFGRDNSGFMGGGQLGYNIQHGPLVFGLEGDFDGMAQSDRARTAVYDLPATALTTGGTVVARTRTDPNWVATVRGRVGLAANRMLFYGTGGVAFVDLTDRAAFEYAPTTTTAVNTANPGTTFGPYTSGGSQGQTHTGWTAGGGVEFKASHNVSFGAEYRHTEIGDYNRTLGFGGANGTYEHVRQGFSDDAVLAKVNLRFDSLGHMF
jgi:outer membrane immunogenic protein